MLRTQSKRGITVVADHVWCPARAARVRSAACAACRWSDGAVQAAGGRTFVDCRYATATLQAQPARTAR